MSTTMRDPAAEQIGPRFQPVRLVLAVLVALLLVSFGNHWYSGRVSLPRYCRQPEPVLQRLATIHAGKAPAGEEAIRDYIVAAKLEFLVPPTTDEPLEAYLQRLRHLLEEQCR